MKFRFSSVPYIVWSVIFVVVPLILVAVFGLSTSDGQFTFANVAKVSDYTAVFVRSIWLSLVATAICLVIAYPLGFIMSRYNANNQRTLVMLVMLPMWTNFLLRTYAWMTILQDTGIFNNFLTLLHLPNIHIIGTEAAVIIGMVYDYFPFMVLPIYNALIKIDRNLLEAAGDLGATPGRTFRKIIFPLSVPGVISGITMVFVPSISEFVIADILGGGKVLLIGNIIEQEFNQGNNWHLGSGISIVLMIFIFVSMMIGEMKGSGEEASLW